MRKSNLQYVTYCIYLLYCPLGTVLSYLEDVALNAMFPSVSQGDLGELDGLLLLLPWLLLICAQHSRLHQVNPLLGLRPLSRRPRHRFPRQDVLLRLSHEGGAGGGAAAAAVVAVGRSRRSALAHSAVEARLGGVRGGGGLFV